MENELKELKVTEFLTNSERLGYAAAGALFAYIGITLTKAACHGIAVAIVGKDIHEVKGTFEVK